MKKILFALMTLFCLVGCNTNDIILENDVLNESIINESVGEDAVDIGDADLSENPLEIHFIDVGQADSILIKSNGKAMLIDAGNNDDADTIVNYLKNQEIKELDYVIGTHPHEDHIGSLDTVINKFDVNTIIMPKKSTTTKTFEDVVTAIENKNLSITLPKVGDKYKIGNGEFTIIAPVKEDYGSNLNNYSVGIIMSYGENKFIFTGDAEKVAEEDIISTNINIDADLMKMGHHGSSTSNSDVLLDKISPKIAIISCGQNNSYGHPHQEVLNEISKRGVEVYRTDLQGNIIVTSDGKEITVKTQKSEKIDEKSSTVDTIKQEDKNYNETTALEKADTSINLITHEYMLNTSTKVFHYTTCSSVKQMSDKNKKTFSGTREEVLNMGYKSCGRCKP